MARISETELTIPCLSVLASVKGGWCSTSELIEILDRDFDPRGKDDKTIANRNDSYFSQKVRNMICHRHGTTSYIARGYALYEKDLAGVGGLRITKKGRALLRQNETKQEATLDARA